MGGTPPIPLKPFMTGSYSLTLMGMGLSQFTLERGILESDGV